MAREIVTSENKAEYDVKKLGIKKEEENVKDISKKYLNQGVESDLFDNKRGIELSRIVIPKEKRGSGLGSKFMTDLISYADKHGKKVVLSPSKDFGASSVDRLKEFYKRHGFVENKGKNKDFTISHSMYRNPEKTDN